MFNSLSIQSKLFIAYFLTIVLFFIIIMTTYTQQVTSFLSNSLVDQTVDAVGYNAQLLENELTNIQKDIIFLSQIDSFQNMIEASDDVMSREYQAFINDTEAAFAQMVKINPEYYQLRYLNENGKEIVRINSKNEIQEIVPSSRLQDKSGRYYFIEAMELQKNELYSSVIDLNREDALSEIEIPYKPVIRYAIPIFNTDNVRKGIIIVNVDISRYLNDIRSKFLTGSLYVMDKQGYFIINSDNSEREWGAPNDFDTNERFSTYYSEEAAVALSGGEGSVQIESNILAYDTISLNSSNPNLYIVISSLQKKASIYEVLYTKMRSLIMIACIVLLFVLVLIIYVLRKSLQPLVLLSNAAKEIGKGHLRERVHIDSKDEIGVLAESFNTMAQSIEETQNKIEKRVSERTTELETLNTMMVDRELRMIELKRELDSCKNDVHLDKEMESKKE